jgi:hypothetical protein
VSIEAIRRLTEYRLGRWKAEAYGKIAERYLKLKIDYEEQVA